jgi:hypothetical protein
MSFFFEKTTKSVRMSTSFKLNMTSAVQKLNPCARSTDSRGWKNVAQTSNVAANLCWSRTYQHPYVLDLNEAAVVKA